MGSFAYIFKQLRIENDLTQQEMAEKLNISRSSVGMYESGEREPNFELTEAIADYFNVDIDFLCGRSPIRKKIHFDNDGNQYLHVDSTQDAPDLDVRRIQRAREKMSEQEKTKMMKILEASFEDYFGDDFIDEDDD